MTPAAATNTLNEALSRALPVEGISLRAFAAPLKRVQHGMRTALTVEVDYPSPSDSSLIDDTLHLGVVAVDHDGTILSREERTFRYTVTRRGLERLKYLINDAIDLPSAPITLRVGVSSEALGRAGTIHIPIEPIDSGKEPLQLSAIVLGLAGPSRENAVPAGALEGLVPFQPTTVRTFSREDTLRVFAQVFWRSNASMVSAELRVDDGEPVDALELSPGGAPGGREDASVDMIVKLDGVSYGAHLLKLVLRQRDGHAAQREIAFQVK